jgi:hypothetical protein
MQCSAAFCISSEKIASPIQVKWPSRVPELQNRLWGRSERIPGKGSHVTQSEQTNIPFNSQCPLGQKKWSLCRTPMEFDLVRVSINDVGQQQQVRTDIISIHKDLLFFLYFQGLLEEEEKIPEKE